MKTKKSYTYDFLKPDEYNRVIDLADEVNLDEKVNFKCKFLAAKNKSGEIQGVAGTDFNYEWPVFKHIIVSKNNQKSKLAVALMMRTEKWLIENGYDVYLCFILHENEIMTEYATKFGFRPYNDKEDGTWYYKKLRSKS